MRSAAEAVAYMREVHSIVRYLQICDGNMQEGSFRCDANVSIRRRGESALGTRTELKNLNSFRFVERGIEHEIERQIDLLESGGEVVQETRLYDPDANETRAMRGKEEANDYRYFPDPDLLPVVISDEFIAEIEKSMPELPDAKRRRFGKQYDLSADDAGMLTASRELADFLEQTVAGSGASPKLCANWIVGELTGALNRAGLEITASRVTPELLGGMIRRIDDGTISGKIAKQIFDAMWNGEGDADTIIEARGLTQLKDAPAIERMVNEVIEANPDQVAQYRAGKHKVLGFFVGQVMKASQGKANPAQVNELLKEKLGS
jgi:aspartyl-tRNA(Asn)/glutamyl-tRNA(Gln) amidotransferase subunit B